MSAWTEKANAVSGVLAAARMRDRIAYDVLANPNVPFDVEADADQAIGILESRFPELNEFEIGQAEEFAQSRGKGKAGRGYRRPGERAPAAKPKASAVARSQGQRPATKGGRAAPAAATRARRGGGRRSSSRGRRYGRRSWEQTGLPGAARSTSEIIMQTLGVTVGLSLLYLLISNAGTAKRGRSAAELFATGVTGLTRRFIAPVDVFAPAAGTSPAGRRSAADAADAAAAAATATAPARAAVAAATAYADYWSDYAAKSGGHRRSYPQRTPPSRTP